MERQIPMIVIHLTFVLMAKVTHLSALIKQVLWYHTLVSKGKCQWWQVL